MALEDLRCDWASLSVCLSLSLSSFPAIVKHVITRIRMQTAGMAFGGTGLCSYPLPRTELCGSAVRLPSSLVWRTPPVHGAVSPRVWSPAHQLSDRPRMPGALDTASRIHQRFMNCATLRTTSCSVRLSNHVLHALLPPSSTASQRYNLRQHAHSLQLPEHSTQLSDSNFLSF